MSAIAVLKIKSISTVTSINFPELSNNKSIPVQVKPIKMLLYRKFFLNVNLSQPVVRQTPAKIKPKNKLIIKKTTKRIIFRFVGIANKFKRSFSFLNVNKNMEMKQTTLKINPHLIKRLPEKLFI